ncbi:hypothetical protein B0J14DRAFT_564127 [Halenospora varia]|nr:hypothetical protein B0J14DRAFT_564127 [Halenospora varia]
MTITSIINFARLADMCGVEAVGPAMAAKLKEVISTNTRYDDSIYNPSTASTFITDSRIISTYQLPQGHAIKPAITAALVGDYLSRKASLTTKPEDGTYANNVYPNGYDDNRKDVYFEDLSVEGQYQPIEESPSRRPYGRYNYGQNTDEEYTCSCEDD